MINKKMKGHVLLSKIKSLHKKAKKKLKTHTTKDKRSTKNNLKN